MRRRAAVVITAAGLWALACGPTRRDRLDEDPIDEADAGEVFEDDAGEVGVDAGLDAGRADAGRVDAGRVDAGSFDAGAADAGPCAGWQAPSLAEPNCGKAPLTVRFSGSALEGEGFEISSIDWDFGDGTGSGQMNPVHAYRTAGDYTAKVTATAYVDSTEVNVNLGDMKIRAHR